MRNQYSWKLSTIHSTNINNKYICMFFEKNILPLFAGLPRDIGDLDCRLAQSGVTIFQNPRWRLNRAKYCERYRKKPCFLHFKPFCCFWSHSTTHFRKERTGLKLLVEYSLQLSQFSINNWMGKNEIRAKLLDWLNLLRIPLYLASFFKNLIISSHNLTIPKATNVYFVVLLFLSSKIQYFHDLRILEHCMFK